MMLNDDRFTIEIVVLNEILFQPAKPAVMLAAEATYGSRKVLMPTERRQGEPSPAPDSQTQVLLTRTQAARRLGVSVSTVRRMEGSELLPLLIDGKHLFRVDEIDRYSNAGEGPVAARAFELFEQGRSPVDVVIALEQPPDRVRQLHDDWVSLSRRVVADAPSAMLVRFFRDLTGGPLPPAAISAALRMLFLDQELRSRWLANMGLGGR